MSPFHSRAVDPGSRQVSPELLAIADRLARQARQDGNVWHFRDVPASTRMRLGWSLKHLAGAAGIGAAYWFRPEYAMGIAAVAMVAAIKLLPKAVREFKAARAAAKAADPQRYRDTMYLAKQLGVAPEDLSYSVLQTLALQYREWRQNAPARAAAEAAKQHLAREQQLRNEIAARKAARVAPTPVKRCRGGWGSRASSATPIDMIEQPEMWPTVNVDGSMMVRGTGIDINGHAYGAAPIGSEL